MKTALTAFAVCATITVGIAAAQQTPPPPPTQAQTQTAPPTQAPPAPQDEQKKDVTLTGCLIQGSAPTVFLFDNAKVDKKSPTEKGVRYLVTVSAEDLDLRPHLNHEVQMVGQISLKPALPPGQRPTEKDLPVFATKSATMISNTCPATAAK